MRTSPPLLSSPSHLIIASNEPQAGIVSLPLWTVPKTAEPLRLANSSFGTHGCCPLCHPSGVFGWNLIPMTCLESGLAFFCVAIICSLWRARGDTCKSAILCLCFLQSTLIFHKLEANVLNMSHYGREIHQSSLLIKTIFPSSLSNSGREELQATLGKAKRGPDKPS